MKKFSSVVLAVILAFNFSFAAISFTDVPENHWAVPYIERMSDLGIIKGYSNGKYGPNDKVSKYVAVLVTYRTLDSQGLIDDNQKTILKNRYQSAISQYSVPSWPSLHEAVGFFIENRIIEPEELRSFSKNGVNSNISREQMGLFLGKALNVFFKDDTGKIITPIFKDHGSINFESLKYINILNNHNIVSGDNVGNYNPQGTLNRAELAKMLSRSIDALKKTKTVAEKSLEAVVQVKLDDTRHIIFYEKGSVANSKRERVTDDIDIIINGKKAGYDDLKLDMIVDLKYKNDKLVAIEVSKNELNLINESGIANNILNSAGKNYLYFKGTDDKITFFNIADNVKITSGDVKASILNIQSGDAIKIGYSGNTVYEIDYKKQKQELTGKLVSLIVDGVPKLTIDVNGGKQTFNLKDGVSVYRNDLRKTMGDLVVGDQILIKIELDEIAEIVANGVQNRELGYISRITVGSKNEIAISDVNGNENTFQLDKNVKVWIDSEAKSSYDLRVNNRVELKLDSDVVTEIKAYTVLDNNYKVGVIKVKYEDLKVFIIRTNDGKDFTINTKNETVYINEKGNKVTFKDFKEDDVVFTFGIVQDNIMSASKVFMLDRK